MGFDPDRSMTSGTKMVPLDNFVSLAHPRLGHQSSCTKDKGVGRHHMASNRARRKSSTSTEMSTPTTIIHKNAQFRQAEGGSRRATVSRLSGRLKPVPRRSPFAIVRLSATTMRTLNVLLLLRLGIWTLANDGPAAQLAAAVSVQRLQVPDLVVIEQPARVSQPQPQPAAHPSRLSMVDSSSGGRQLGWPQRDAAPQAASLVNNEQQQPSMGQQQQQITFECLVSFDRKRDKNLIIKWHHDERNEPIYQWIPELNKRSVAPQYRAYIAPITAAGHHSQAAASESGNSTVQLLEAGFRLIRPTKELGGKYTCSAISSQNDDSKSKKMIVYTPPRSFRFNVTRADIGALLANQRDRLILMTQPAGQTALSSSQLPLAYRMRGLVEPSQTSQQQQQLMTMAMNGLAPTTISPQMYSTIDYVNVNHQQRTRQQLMPPPPIFSASANANFRPNAALPSASGQQAARPSGASRQQFGLKLVCDIDQVFPVPEVSIYRRASPGGAGDPSEEKLAKLDTRIERDVATGLFHVQVISIVDDDELHSRHQSRPGGWSAPSSAADVHFECAMALTNLELGKYGDNKRSVVYRAGQQQVAPMLTNGALQVAELDQSTRIASAGVRVQLQALGWLAALLLLSSTTLVAASAGRYQIPDH